jgi:hypothetical protein
MAIRTELPDERDSGRLGAVDRSLYVLFARHADRSRHDADRRRYRGAALSIGFDRYLARVYGASWVLGLAVGLVAAGLAATVPAAAIRLVVELVHGSLPLVERLSAPSVPRGGLTVGVGLLAGAVAKRGVVALGGTYLRWRTSARRTAIDRSLPGAVRYLRALASGSDDRREILRKVADSDAYGETSRSFQRVLNTAALTGSVDEGLRRTARDTPSRGLLAPFLLKFREHAGRGSDALERYLRMESRMLSHRQARERQRAGDFLELLAELFIVLLIVPALLVVIVTVLSVLAPGLGRSLATPLGTTTPRALLVHASAAFVLLVGVAAAGLVGHLRPPSQSRPDYSRPGGTGSRAHPGERHRPRATAGRTEPRGSPLAGRRDGRSATGRRRGRRVSSGVHRENSPRVRLEPEGSAVVPEAPVRDPGGGNGRRLPRGGHYLHLS